MTDSSSFSIRTKAIRPSRPTSLAESGRGGEILVAPVILETSYGFDARLARIGEVR
jgi:hypothetical protein